MNSENTQNEMWLFSCVHFTTSKISGLSHPLYMFDSADLSDVSETYWRR